MNHQRIMQQDNISYYNLASKNLYILSKNYIILVYKFSNNIFINMWDKVKIKDFGRKKPINTLLLYDIINEVNLKEG